MSRHTAPVFRQSEKKKAKYGSHVERLGADAMRPLEACWLCLQTARDPCCSPDGFVFCKSCIILNFGEQKEEHSKRILDFEREQREKDVESAKRMISDEDKKLEEFLAASEGFVSKADVSMAGKLVGESQQKFVVLDKQEERKASFWIPENAPSAAKTVALAPSTKVVLVNPINLTPMKLSELITLCPKVLDDKWICPVSDRLLSHHKVVAVKKSGEVFSKEAAEKFVVGDESCSWAKSKVTKKTHLVELIPGGTGFSAHNNIEAKRGASSGN